MITGAIRNQVEENKATRLKRPLEHRVFPRGMMTWAAPTQNEHPGNLLPLERWGVLQRQPRWRSGLMRDLPEAARTMTTLGVLPNGQAPLRY